MADVKITQLTELAAAPAVGDELAIVDNSVSQTKRISIANLFTNPNVTGTLTADGLTVLGSALTNKIIRNFDTLGGAAASTLQFGAINDGSVVTPIYLWGVTETDGTAQSFHIKFDSTATSAFKAEANGDISFYEDTGTTAKFFWDASDESLGIGTTSPSAPIHLSGSSATNTKLRSEHTGSSLQLDFVASTNSGIVGTATNHPLDFYTNGSERMRIDSTGNVGIGTTSPAAPLEVAGSATTSVDVAYFSNSNSVEKGIIRLNGLGAGVFVLRDSVNNEDVVLSAQGNSHFNGGNVGIGTTSPNASLEISNINGGTLRLHRDDTSVTGGNTIGRIEMSHDDTDNSGVGAYLEAVAEGSSGVVGLVFGTGTAGSATERMRIDSTGNLLVGKSATDITAEGIELRENGKGMFTASATDPVFVNRLTSDGEIIKLAKDGLAVGTIGVVSSDNMYVTSTISGQSGIGFVTGAITPYDSGTETDNATNLGNSTNRFKDLYLSGGVYLGGTGAANLLDDYEEGTWTPTLTGNTTAGDYTVTATGCKYIKIGNLVTVIGKMAITVNSSGTGLAKFGGLPFTSTASSTPQGAMRSSGIGFASGTVHATIILWSSSTTDFSIGQTKDGAGQETLDIAGVLTGDFIEFSLTYQTA
jgi:hypothetical protein